jgi:hypothetical protein
MAIARNLLQRVGGRAGTAAPQGAVCELPNPLFRSTSFSYPSTWLKFRGSCEHRRFGVAGCWATSASVVCKSIEAGEWRKGMKPDAAALPRSAALVENWMKDFSLRPYPGYTGEPDDSAPRGIQMSCFQNADPPHTRLGFVHVDRDCKLTQYSEIA